MRARLPRSEAQSRVSTVHVSSARLLARINASHLGCVNQTISAFGNDLRSPLTAGNACTMSPSEPRRTTRNRGSAIWRLAHNLQQLARRMILGIADNRHADAQP